MLVSVRGLNIYNVSIHIYANFKIEAKFTTWLGANLNKVIKSRAMFYNKAIGRAQQV